MQRIGRINRIGGTAKTIRIFNSYRQTKLKKVWLAENAQIKLQAFHFALGEDSQIYTAEEEVDTFGLFSRVTKEESNEQLQYLMELRKFREEDPNYFEKIKKMPLKIRNAVKNQN